MVLICQYITTMIGYNFRQNSVNYNNRETNGEISYERIIFNRYGIADCRKKKSYAINTRKTCRKNGCQFAKHFEYRVRKERHSPRKFGKFKARHGKAFEGLLNRYFK